MPIIRWFVPIAMACCGVAEAGPVTFRTDASQLCVGAPGCGVNEQSIASAVTVRFEPVPASTVVAGPQSFASLGRLVVQCVGGGTACVNTSLAGLNLFINLAQTVPGSGNGSLAGGAITGTIRGSASNATIAWASPTQTEIGTIRYRIVTSPLALVPPSANGGVVSIQAEITDLGPLPGPQP
jgi:hypothetical protein